MRKHSIGLAAVLLTVSACSGYGGTENNGNNNNQNPPSQPAGTPAMAATVEVRDDYYSPNSTLLAAGGTVTWEWIGTDGHSVTSDGSPAFASVTTTYLPPHTLAVTFPTAGDYRYYCTTHGVAGYYGSGTMIGTVFVK